MRLFILMVLVLFSASLFAVDVAVDCRKKHQEIEGFGTCIVAWVNNIKTMLLTTEFQKQYLKDVGCSMLRVNLWGETMGSPVENWQAISHKNFNTSIPRHKIYVDYGAALKKLDPNLRIVGTVWSPPPWMKYNNNMVDKKRSRAIRADKYGNSGNRVKPEYFQHYVKWIVEMAKHYAARGAPLYAISPGNEVQFNQSFESCVWTGDDFAKIIAMLGKQLEAEGLGHIKLFGPETMTSHFYEGGTGTYIKKMTANPETMKYLYAFATHGYEDGVKAETSANSSRNMWESIKDYGKRYWVTEGGTHGHTWPEPITKGIAVAAHNALVAGNASVFLPWVISERGRSTHNLMDMTTMTPKSYAASHFFRFVRPGSFRVDTAPAFSDVLTSSFLHEKQKTLTIVVINPKPAEAQVNIGIANNPGVRKFKAFRTSASDSCAPQPDVSASSGRLSLTMPGHSIVTLIGGFQGSSGSSEEKKDRPKKKKPAVTEKPAPQEDDEWKTMLYTRIADAVKSGRRVSMHDAKMGGEKTIKSIDEKTITFSIEMGAAGSIVTPSPVAKLTLKDRKAFALALAEKGNAGDHALAAYYLLITGDKTGAIKHMMRSGKYKEKIRKLM